MKVVLPCAAKHQIGASVAFDTPLWVCLPAVLLEHLALETLKCAAGKACRTHFAARIPRKSLQAVNAFHWQAALKYISELFLNCTYGNSMKVFILFDFVAIITIVGIASVFCHEFC